MLLSVLLANGVPAEPPESAAIVPEQQWTKWDRATQLDQCRPLETEEKVDGAGCAEHWQEDSEDSNRRDREGALLTSFIKDTDPLDLLRQIEYHFLLGVSHAVLFDNSCNEDGDYSKLAKTLAGHIEKKRVVLRTEYRCKDAVKIFPELYPIGGSGIALQTIARTPELHPKKGTLIFAIDDDEYVAMHTANQSLTMLKDELAGLGTHHSAQLRWRMFGSSWHVCQPAGSVVRNFVHRSPRQGPTAAPESSGKYRKLATEEAQQYHLNLPFSPHSGKFVVLWQSDEQIKNCSTHFCGPPLRPQDTSGPSPQSKMAWLAHYAYQSEQHWEAKKARGRTTTGQRGEDREGDVPSSYNYVRDDTVLHGLEYRIRAVTSAPLRKCLQTLFGPPPAPSTGSVLAPLPLNKLKCPRMPDEPQSCAASKNTKHSVDLPVAHEREHSALKVCCPCDRDCSVKRRVPEALLQLETKCSPSLGRCLVLPSDSSDVWESPAEQAEASKNRELPRLE